MKKRIAGKSYFLLIIAAIIVHACTSTPTPAPEPTRTATITPSPIISLSPTATSIPTATKIPFNWALYSSVDFLERDITAIAFDPLEPDVIYVGTQSIGIYKSIDGGGSWQAINGGVEMTEVTQIIINIQDPRILLIRAKQGLFRSVDGGVSWHKKLSGHISLIADVLDPSQLYAWDDSTFNTMLYKSVDHGAYWTKKNEFLLVKLVFFKAAFDPWKYLVFD